MKRLLINSNMWGIYNGIVTYGAARGMASFYDHPHINELDYFSRAFITIWLCVAPLVFVAGLSSLRRQRRIPLAFNLRDLERVRPSFERSVRLRCPPAEFKRRVALVLAHNLNVLTIANEVSAVTAIVQCSAKDRYAISALVSVSGSTALLGVRRCGAMAPLSLVDLVGVQVLGGLVNWAVERQIIERDFPSDTASVFAKELGSWVRLKRDGWEALAQEVDPAAVVEASRLRRRRLLRIFRIRMMLAGIVTIVMFFALVLFDPSERIPRVVKLTPILLLTAYMTRLLRRIDQPVDFTGNGEHRFEGRG